MFGKRIPCSYCGSTGTVSGGPCPVCHGNCGRAAAACPASRVTAHR